MGFFSAEGEIVGGVRKTVKAIKGAKDVIDGVSSVLNPSPGGQQLGSIVAGKPRYSFDRGAVPLSLGADQKYSLGETLNAATTVPEWIRLQNAYLYYLNSSDRYSEPGKVGRTIKV